MISSYNKTYFIIPTASKINVPDQLEPYYLGPWCCPEKYGADHSIICNWRVFDSLESKSEFYEEFKENFQFLLDVLSEELNKIHNENLSKEAWLIILGHWLMLHVSVVMDRIARAEDVKNRYPNKIIAPMVPNSPIPPWDTDEYSGSIMSDDYNLWLYSEIFKLIGVNQVEIDRVDLEEKRTEIKRKPGVIRKLFHSLISCPASFMRGCYIRNAYFSLKDMFLLSFYSGGRIAPVIGRGDDFCKCNENVDLRNCLLDGVKNNNRKTAFPVDITIKTIPRIYLEGFGGLVDLVKRRWPSGAGRILSSSAWYSDEQSKVWLALEKNSGTKIIGIPHGGNYLPLKNMFLDEFEKNICDVHFSWGRADKSTDNVFLTSPRLLATITKARTVSAINSSKEILFCGTSYNRYGYYPFSFVEDFYEYLDLQKRFIFALRDDILNRMRFRPHGEGVGFDAIREIRESKSNLFIEQRSVDFIDSLVNCRLYVSDHLSTTYTQALVLNKPMMMFWKDSHYPIKENLKDSFNSLRECGVLLNGPEEAADKLAEIMDLGISVWWNQKSIQESIRLVRDSVASVSKNWRAEWASALMA